MFLITKTYPCNKERFCKVVKNEEKKFYSLTLIVLLKITDCWYTLEPPRRGGFYEYPQFMFWIRNKENRYTL